MNVAFTMGTSRSSSPSSSVSRRAMLASAAAPLFVPARLFGRNAPGNRISVGLIGVGRQTRIVNIPQFLSMPDVQIVAVCDVDSWRLENARKQVDEGYAKANQSSYKGCVVYRDYREMLANKSIDAVMIGTPDHWHVPMCMDAVRAGKDVSCEKPLTRSIGEGRQLAALVAKHKRVFRTDSEWRSIKTYHAATELIRNGRIGEIQSIISAVPRGDVGCPPQPDMPVPDELDYELWQGPAPRAAYTEYRVHKPKAYERPGWMRRLEYCDGMVTNWGTHLNDIVQWANGTERSGPVSIEGRGTYPDTGSFWNVLLDFEVEYRFVNGVKLTYKIDQPYLEFRGTEGSIWVDAVELKTKPGRVADVKSTAKPWESLPFKSDKQDFIDAVKTRGNTLEDAEVGHRTTSLCHLAHIAVHYGKPLEWDPAKEQFTNDPKANEYISKPIYAPGCA
jgi:myo-inositol 2-dehydrogenase / D-chiro-inositol 1-dehydrogenase